MSANAINRPDSPQGLDDLQLEALNQVIAAQAENRFYRRKLQAAGLTGGADSLESFRERMPFTTKDELVADQRENPPYGTNLALPLSHYVRFHQTSATSGKRPLIWLDTPENWGWMVENWRRVLEHAGLTADDRIFMAFSFGPFLGFWTAHEAAQRIGALVIPGGGLSTEARLRLICEHEVDMVCCTPTYALRLAEVALHGGIDLSQTEVRRIVVGGEPGGSLPAMRAAVQAGWGGRAEMFDHHGMTEIGPVTYEDPARPGNLRVLAERYLTEVIDPETTEPVPRGEPGELVLTTLGREGSPLLRYRTGDLVKWVEMPMDNNLDPLLEGGIIGRIDDMIVVRGVNLYPTALDEVIRAIEGVAEYRALIDQSQALTEIRLEVEPAAGLAQDQKSDLAASLENALRHTFALRVPVTLVEENSLPRFELKAKRWVRVAQD